jgi:hypothetical protein
MPIPNSEIEKILEPENKLQLLEPGLWYKFDEIYEIVFGEKVNASLHDTDLGKIIANVVFGEKVNASLLDTDLGKIIANGLVQAINIAVLRVRIVIEIDRGTLKEGMKGDLYYYSRIA